MHNLDLYRKTRASFIWDDINFQQYEQVMRRSITEPQWLLSRYLDQSFVVSSNLQQKKKGFLNYFTQLCQKFSFIRPQSTALLFWNILVLVSQIFNYLQIPISLFFTDRVYYSEFHSAWSMILNVFFLLILFINMIFIRPLTGYYSQGKLNLQKQEILKRYVKIELWLNLVSWFSLMCYIFSNNPYFIYPKLVFYLSFYCSLQINGLVSSKLQLMKVRHVIYKFIRQVCYLLFAVLWLGGIFFAIDYYLYETQSEYYPQNLWLTNSVSCQYADGSFINLIQTYDWEVWLVYSLYWTLQSVSLLGYGDITPRNPYEVAYTDVVIVTMTLMYALFISSTWQIISQFLQDGETNSKKILKQYEKKYNMKGDTVVKLSNYAFEAAKSKDSQEKQLQILETLPDQLKSELLFSRQKRLYVSIPFFNQLSIFNQEYTEMLHYLALVTQIGRYGYGQVLFKEQSFNNDLSHIIVGTVELSYQNSKLIKTAESNQFFNNESFLTKSKTKYNARALKFSKISSLNINSFMQALKKIPIIYKKCCELFEEVKIYKIYELTGEICWSCQSRFHSTVNCYLFFQWLADLRQTQGKKQFYTYLNYSFRKFMYRSKKKSKKFYLNKNETKKNFSFSLKKGNHNNVDKIYNYRVYRNYHNF